MKIIGVIPARLSSTRLKQKVLADILGKPMIQRVYEQATKAQLVGRVVVATDHNAIADVVRAFGGAVMMTPATLQSGSDRVAYVAEQIPDAEIVVNVQGDEPLISPIMIDETIRPLADDRSIEVGTPVRIISSTEDIINPGTVKVVIDQAGFAIYFSRSPIPHLRDVPDVKLWHTKSVYYKHIGLYVFRRSALMNFTRWSESELERAEKLEQLRFLIHGIRIKTVITTFDSIPIDTAEDAEMVREIMHRAASVNL